MDILRLNYPIEEIRNTLLADDCLSIANVIQVYGKGETYKEMKMPDVFKRVKTTMNSMEFHEAIDTLRKFGLITTSRYGRYFVNIAENTVENEVALDFLDWMLPDVFDVMTEDGFTNDQLKELFEEYQNEKRDPSE